MLPKKQRQKAPFFKDALHTWNVWVENPETRYFRCTGSLQHIIYPLSDITDSGISPKRQPPTLRRLDLNQRPSGYEPNELPRLLYSANQDGRTCTHDILTTQLLCFLSYVLIGNCWRIPLPVYTY